MVSESQSEVIKIILKILMYGVIILTIYVFYKSFFKRDGKIARPAKIFAWIGGILFSFIGVGSLLFLIVSLIVPEIPNNIGVMIILLINIIIFGGLGIILILVAKDKWITKQIK